MMEGLIVLCELGKFLMFDCLFDWLLKNFFYFLIWYFYYFLWILCYYWIMIVCE